MPLRGSSTCHDWPAEESAPLLDTLSCREDCYRTGMQELRRLRELRRRECDRAGSLDGDGLELTTPHQIRPTLASVPVPEELTAAALSWRWMWLSSLGAMCVVAVAIVCVNVWVLGAARQRDSTSRLCSARLPQNESAKRGHRETTQAAVAELEREIASEQKRVAQLNYEVATHEGGALFEPNAYRTGSDSSWQSRTRARTTTKVGSRCLVRPAALAARARVPAARPRTRRGRELILEHPSLETHRHRSSPEARPARSLCRRRRVLPDHGYVRPESSRRRAGWCGWSMYG